MALNSVTFNASSISSALCHPSLCTFGTGTITSCVLLGAASHSLPSFLFVTQFFCHCSCALSKVSLLISSAIAASVNTARFSFSLSRVLFCVTLLIACFAHQPSSWDSTVHFGGTWFWRGSSPPWCEGCWCEASLEMITCHPPGVSLSSG